MQRLILALALLLAACASAQDVPAAHAEPAHAGGYDIVRTSLGLIPDLTTHTIASAQQMTTIRAEADLTELRFDLNALTLDSAHVDGAAANVRREERGLILTLPRRYTAGETLRVEFRYHGAPARGLTFQDGAFYTSYFSCDWMYCELDRPGDKFEFHPALAMPMPPGSAEPALYASEVRRAYPAYIQGFGGGALTTVRSRAGAVDLIYASPHATEEELRTLFAETSRMLAFFQRRAGTPFPHREFTQLLVRGDEAQEGAGFSVLGEDVLRPMLANPHEDWAIAHELAHTYWGNLITCRDWSHFWLNEGVTTFMVAAWKQERWGEADYQREVELARARVARVREAGWDRPLAFAGAYPDLRTRRAIQYAKGMLFMVELRNTLGEDVFWRAFARYTRTNAGGVVESADLQHAFEAESGRDLQALFDAWVYPAP